MQCRFPGWHWLLLLLIFACVGCERPALEKTAERTRRPRRSRATRVAAVDCDLTIEDGQRFALRLLHAVGADDAQAFSNLIDWDSIVDLATRGYEVPPNMHGELVRGVKSATDNGVGFICELLGEVRGGASFSVLQIHVERDYIGVWCRLVSSDGVIAYQDYRLHQGANGAVLARDVFASNCGETIAELMRPILVDAVRHELRSAVTKLTTEPELHVKYAREFKQIVEWGRSGNHAAAVKLYRELPEEMRRNKCLLMNYLNCAAQLSAEDCDLAIQDATQFYPDGSFDNVLIYHLAAKEKFHEAIACLDRVNRMVGGDVLLTDMRVTLLARAGEIDAARELALAMIEWSPNQFEGYAAGLQLALDTDDFATIVNLLEALKSRDLEVPHVESLPAYAEFVESEQYEEWQREQHVAQQPDQEPDSEHSTWPRQL